MLRVVISDTSPVHYLVLIGHVALLPDLYKEVLIPQSVADELQRPAAPEPVRRWIADPPQWLQVVSLTAQPSFRSLDRLDRGEHDAIVLALELKADLVLMDDREAVQEARGLGLSVTGTLGVLDRAAQRGLIELAPAIAQLRQTNFRVDPALLERLLAADERKRRK